jgi:hypothetical protein
VELKAKGVRRERKEKQERESESMGRKERGARVARKR